MRIGRSRTVAGVADPLHGTSSSTPAGVRGSSRQAWAQQQAGSAACPTDRRLRDRQATEIGKLLDLDVGDLEAADRLLLRGNHVPEMVEALSVTGLR